MTRKTVKIKVSTSRKWFTFVGTNLSIGNHWFKSNNELVKDIEEIMRKNTTCKKVHLMYKCHRQDYYEIVEYSV